ncbi:MAG TPA: hypothetical protein VFT10_04775, partial [Solirubrobacterales bacterium]|nr:hypothetical protein [Solirubrobacterales bacterium]
MGSRLALLFADSFPSEAGDFVSDNIQYFVAGLVAAILLLLLVVSVTQRRSKEKAKKEGGKAGA